MMYTFFMSKKETKNPPYSKRNYYDVSDTGIAYFGAIVAPYVIMIVAIILMGILSSQLSQSVSDMGGSLAYTIVACFFAPIGYAALFFGFNKKRNISFKAANLRFKMKTWDFVMCFVVVLICLFGLQYFIGGFNHLLEMGGYELSEVALPLDNVGWLILAILLMAVLPAIFEEFIFRGMIMNGLRSKMGDVCAIFISAAMFAFAHGSIEQLLYQFALGVVIAWMVIRTGSLASGILIHFLNNAIVLVLSYISLHYGGVEMVYNAWQWVVCVVLVLVAAVLIFVIEKFYFKHKNRELEPEKKEDEPDKPESTDPKKQPYPIMLWFAMGVAVVLFLFNTLSGFGVFSFAA